MNGNLNRHPIIEDKAYTSISSMFSLEQYGSEWWYGQND